MENTINTNDIKSKKAKMVKVKFNQMHIKGQMINGKFQTKRQAELNYDFLVKNYQEEIKQNPYMATHKSLEQYVKERMGAYVYNDTWNTGDIVELDEELANFLCNKKIGEITVDGKTKGHMKFYFENGKTIPKNIYRDEKEFNRLFEHKYVANVVDGIN